MATDLKPAEALILKGKEKIIRLLPAGQDKSRTHSLMLRIARSPELVKCEPTSVLLAILDAATMGLSLTPNMGEAYILPAEIKGKQVARLEIGYKGYISMAKRAGIRTVQAEVVRKGDTFSYSMGLNPTLEHVRNSQFGDPMTHAYAKAKIEGEWIFYIADEKEVLHAKSKSKSARSEYSPWNTHPESMWKKTAIKRLLNSQSLSSELNAIVGYDTNEELNKAEPMIDLGDAELDIEDVQEVQDTDLPA